VRPDVGDADNAVSIASCKTPQMIKHPGDCCASRWEAGESRGTEDATPSRSDLALIVRPFEAPNPKSDGNKKKKKKNDRAEKFALSSIARFVMLLCGPDF